MRAPRFMRVLAAIVSLVATTAIATPQPATAAAAARLAVPNDAIFNDPVANPKAIEDHIVNLIANAEGQIRVTTYAFASNRYKNALIDAHEKRGVVVQVVADDRNGGSDPDNPTTFDQLKEYFDRNPNDFSWVMECSGACVTAGSGGINHNKFMLFSRVLGSTNVVVQPSANMVSATADGNSGVYSWNNSITLAGDTVLYYAFLERFEAMANQRAVKYSSTNGATAKVYFFPRETGADTNTILNILESVTCTGQSVGYPGGLTTIKVAMYKFTDRDIALRLKALDAAGCVVYVLRTEYGPDDDAATAVLDDCTAHNGIVLKWFDKDADGDNHDEVGYLHSKYMLIEGGYNGQNNQRVVFTGSYNFANDALRENDETLLRILNDLAIYSDYELNFDMTLMPAAPHTTPTPDC